mmetsp:Transcript_813/g.2044  ORF Transcript_813/g.2044 Transcript_813/m.2044 type:complete len:137 (-) Transcript_813:159-569(-)
MVPASVLLGLRSQNAWSIRCTLSYRVLDAAGRVAAPTAYRSTRAFHRKPWALRGLLRITLQILQKGPWLQRRQDVQSVPFMPIYKQAQERRQRQVQHCLKASIQQRADCYAEPSALLSNCTVRNHMAHRTYEASVP